MARRHDPVADSLPPDLREGLEEMRAVAHPYLERIVADLDAHPTTVLERLPAVRDALAVDDEEFRLALVAAAMERHLDSGHPMWQTLRVLFSMHRLGRDASVATLLGADPVIVALSEVAAERWREERARDPAAPDEEPSWPRPLAPHLEERLYRHRFAAAPWLGRVETIIEATREAYETVLEAMRAGRHLELRDMLADAGVEKAVDIGRDVKEQPPDVQVSIALTWLDECLHGRPTSKVYELRLWHDLNRRALPYEPDDLELGLVLLEGHDLSWFYGKELVRAIERHGKNAGGIPERWHDPLRALLAAMTGMNRKAEYQRAAGTIRSLLGTAGAGEAAARLDVSSIDGADAWSTTVRARLSETYGDDAGLNRLLGLLQGSGTAPRPGAPWRSRVDAALAASPASIDVLRLLLETAVEVREDLVQRTASGDWLYSALGEPAAMQIRAAGWAAALSGAEWAPDLLERLARDYSEMLFRGEPHSARVANGAASALALRSGRDAVARLARLQRGMWHGAIRKHIERELDSLAAAAELTRGQLLELSAPDLGLGPDGTATLAVGSAGSLTLTLDDRCRLVAHWSAAGDGAGKAAPPRTLRAAEPERVNELQQLVKQSRASLAVEHDRVDGLLAEQPRWRRNDWAASYVEHPVLRAFGRTLVWNVDLGDEVRAGTPGERPHSFVSADGAVFEAPDNADLTLWHPVAAADADVAAWRAALFERRLVQPVRQVFREVYRLAPGERGSRYSTRFAGRLLRHQPLRGLFKRRGWKSPGLYAWDDAGPDVAHASRLFPGFGIRAELRYRPEWSSEDMEGTPGAFVLVSTDELRFYPAAKKGAGAVVLEDVPALVVSEAMRDLDLFVSVCSVGLDASWRDTGDEQTDRQWREHAFGELVESARIRREVLGYVLPELSIADRCAVYDRDLVVDGSRATYRIHLGSAQIRVDPSGAPLVLPAPPVGGRELAELFLPVEADDTLTAVLSTAFLLANDDAVTDPDLLAQLPEQKRL